MTITRCGGTLSQNLITIKEKLLKLVENNDNSYSSNRVGFTRKIC